MTEPVTFNWFIHLITIPLTLGVGFFIGWVLRGAAERRTPRKPGSMTPVS